MREKARCKLIDDAFAEEAKKLSACPSKIQGGDVGWFDRTGVMVESFAKTAFALQPYQMSDVVQTQFGYHLILLTERRRSGGEVRGRQEGRQGSLLRSAARVAGRPTPPAGYHHPDACQVITMKDESEGRS